MQNHRTSVGGDFVRGAIAGAVGTWVMDQVTTALLEQASEEDKAREQAVRPNGKSSAANLVDLVTDPLGLELADDQRTQAATAVHWALGIVPGAVYGALRNRVPLVGAARGLGFGAVLFAANDEYLNTALGLAADPGAYPASTHLRGLAGHLVLGATTDTVLDVLGG
jgi:hypothetical protein